MEASARRGEERRGGGLAVPPLPEVLFVTSKTREKRTFG